MRRSLGVLLSGFVLMSGMVGLAGAPAAAAPKCGQTAGPKVQVVYAYTQGADNSASMTWRAQVAAWEVNQVFDASARRQGGARQVRWALNAKCQVDVKKAGLPAAQTEKIATLVAGARAKLKIPANQKILVYTDAANFAEYCIGEGTGITGGGFALIASKICGFSVTKTVHELGHTFGIPHCDAASGLDPMCEKSLKVCKAPVNGQLYDSCRTDKFTYFDVKPKRGSYLAKNPKKNMANSPYLMKKRTKVSTLRIQTPNGGCLTATTAGVVTRKCGQQIWQRVIDAQGYTRLVDKKSGLCLATGGGKVGVRKCAKNKASQQWLVLADPVLGAQIQHAGGAYVTVEGNAVSATGKGTPLRFTR